jgi:hypothetical protein
MTSLTGVLFRFSDMQVQIVPHQQILPLYLALRATVVIDGMCFLFRQLVYCIFGRCVMVSILGGKFKYQRWILLLFLYLLLDHLFFDRVL